MTHVFNARFPESAFKHLRFQFSSLCSANRLMPRSGDFSVVWYDASQFVQVVYEFHIW